MKDVNPVYRIIAVRTAQASLAALAAHRLLGWPLTGRRAVGLFLTPALCLYFTFVFVARWSWGLPILTRLPVKGKEEEKTVALTFDDGPSPESTPAVLDALAPFGVHATFFVLGEAVERSPELLRRIVAEGHSVGLHGHRHRAFVLLSGRNIREEIGRAREAVRRACSEAAISPWLRPPHGFKSPGVLWAVGQAGFHLAGWSVDGRDYRETDPERLARNVLDALRPGAVVLLHDGPRSAATVSALPAILQGLRDQEWQPVLLPTGLRGTP